MPIFCGLADSLSDWVLRVRLNPESGVAGEQMTSTRPIPFAYAIWRAARMSLILRPPSFKPVPKVTFAQILGTKSAGVNYRAIILGAGYGLIWINRGDPFRPACSQL